MTTTTTANVTLALSALAQAAGGLGNPQLNLSLQLAAASLTSGTGANKVNQLYQTTATLAASATLDIDMYAFGGALDIGGNAYVMATCKILIVQVVGVTGAIVEADYMTIGGKGTTAGWTSPFNANTDKLKIFSGGLHFLFDPGSTGYVIGASTTNHLLTLTAGANTGAVTYNFIAIGATA